MNQLWKVPPVTPITRGPYLKVLPKREYEISFLVESENGGEKPHSLKFVEVEAFKCTHMKALGSVPREVRQNSYFALIEVENSPWFKEVSGAHETYCASAKLKPPRLKHLVMTFDDDPCFEFICAGFRIDKGEPSQR